MRLKYGPSVSFTSDTNRFKTGERSSVTGCSTGRRSGCPSDSTPRILSDENNFGNDATVVEQNAKMLYAPSADAGCKRVLLIAAAILVAHKLASYDPGTRVPATISAIADAVRSAEETLKEIDRRWPGR
jgi:hypothetical protein